MNYIYSVKFVQTSFKISVISLNNREQKINISARSELETYQESFNTSNKFI